MRVQTFQVCNAFSAIANLKSNPPPPTMCATSSPTKSEFLRAKYQMLSCVHKRPCRDDDGITTKDRSKVRACPTSHLLSTGQSSQVRGGFFLFELGWHSFLQGSVRKYTHTHTHTRDPSQPESFSAGSNLMTPQEVLMGSTMTVALN